MITYVLCDLLESPAQVLVNTVNTVGVMGKGIAKDFRLSYPEMFNQYQQICQSELLDIGDLWIYKAPDRWVLNFPTKRHWRRPSRPEYIEAGLRKFVETYDLHGITSISFPQMGCGNGGLDWDVQVQPLMDKYLSDLPVMAFVHVQQGQPSHGRSRRDRKALRERLRGVPESISLSDVWSDLRTELNSPVELSRTDNGQPFRAVANGPVPGLTITEGDQMHDIPAEAIADLWVQLRLSGFVGVNDLPSGLDDCSAYLAPILGELPYIEPVAMAHCYDQLSSAAADGLRFSPRAHPPALPLFSGAVTVEPE